MLVRVVRSSVVSMRFVSIISTLFLGSAVKLVYAEVYVTMCVGAGVLSMNQVMGVQRFF